MKKRIYLSGPISGKPIEEARAAFETAETAAIAAGRLCYNPQKEVPSEALNRETVQQWQQNHGDEPECYSPCNVESWSDCMRIALRGLLLCHEIHMLPGWQQSEGAKLEHHIALALGMPATRPEGEEHVEQSGFPEINWSKFRRRFFDQCTDSVDGNPGIRKINYAPHDFLEWLRENITDCPQMVWFDRKPNLTDLATEFTAWSRTAFPEADWGNSLTKLSQEIDEVWEATTSESDHGVALELADCLMCVFDSAARLGINSQMLTEAFSVKLEANKKRQWQRNADGTYSHVK